MKKILFTFIFIGYISVSAIAQTNRLTGKVYAFKDQPLKNIEVVAKKSKKTVYTDSLGIFRIECQAKDLLEFNGNGFQKTKHKIDFKKPEARKLQEIKMIITDHEKNRVAAVEGLHISKEKLEENFINYPEYNYNYFNYPDVFNAIARINAGNDNIRISGNQVFVRDENSVFSQSPAIFILNGQLALDINDLQTRDIETIKIISDGSARYGIRASSGAVIISTFKK